MKPLCFVCTYSTPLPVLIYLLFKKSYYHLQTIYISNIFSYLIALAGNFRIISKSKPSWLIPLLTASGVLSYSLSWLMDRAE